ASWEAVAMMPARVMNGRSIPPAVICSYHRNFVMAAAWVVLSMHGIRSKAYSFELNRPHRPHRPIPGHVDKDPRTFVASHGALFSSASSNAPCGMERLHVHRTRGARTADLAFLPPLRVFAHALLFAAAINLGLLTAGAVPSSTSDEYELENGAGSSQPGATGGQAGSPVSFSW
ncbi:MAG TPA: hypothetical protein VN903_36030, partial [Polyangia bacterium]|nr:hypothetical protein [Polyangia bacterium]